MSKNKKTIYTNLHVLFMREKDIPIEVFEGDLKDRTVSKVAWEPNGNRFALIAHEGLKTFVSFFQADKSEIKELKTFERKNISHLFWSPKGRFIVLAALINVQGEMEFWDGEELQLLGTVEHYQAKEVEWDPSGRYVASTLSYWRYQSENGFNLWDFRGQPVLKKTMERFKQFLWRPRPPSLLSKDQMKHIRRHLKDYAIEFDEIDAKLSGDVAAKAEVERRKVHKQWIDWCNIWQKRHSKERDLRARLRGGGEEDSTPVYSDDEKDCERRAGDGQAEMEIEELEEELIEESVEVLVD